MLEKPEINNDILISCLNEGYAKGIRAVSFLPIGADMNTALYTARATDNTSYFVKLRRGPSNEAAVAVPSFLAETGMRQVIPALRTQTGGLRHPSGELGDTWVMTLHPFVEGHHGYQQRMTTMQWTEFGTALKRPHTTDFPAQIIEGIPREDFSTQWHKELRTFLADIERKRYVDPIAAQLAEFMTRKRTEIVRLIEEVEKSLQSLLRKVPEFVLCHADIHCWNLLIDDRTGALHIVDWDTLIFAPKELDLMFVGAGLAESGYTSAQEAEMFFRGYGQTVIDHNTIKYYRCARIIEDLVIYCRQIFQSEDGGENRKQALEFVRSNFRPNGTVARAFESL